VTRSHIAAPSAAGRWIALLLAVGACAVVLAATPYDGFDLDRHAVPKELALHLTALLAGAAAWFTRRRAGAPALARLDQYLALYLAWCTASFLFTTNHWLGFRGLALSASGLVCYWAARQAAALGAGHLVRGGVAVALTVGAATGLLQAYGAHSPFFAETRVPGGTFGNRNFLAHVAAIGLPVLLATALGARRAGGSALATLGVLLTTMILFLSRSRAAWLGAIAAIGVLALWALIGACPPFDAIRRRRLGLLLIAMGTAIGAAIVLPNALDWRSDHPYAETVKNVVNASEGSGRGRLIQYRNTLTLVRQDPLFGVGPGNWAVRYPTVTQPGDPAYVPGATVPTNPWPSSDWIAIIAERGPVAMLLLIAAFVGLGLRAWRTARDGTHPRRAEAWGAAGVAVALVTVGIFDAVLLNAAPSLLGLAALGAMVPVDDAANRRRAVPIWAVALLGVIVVGGVVRSSQNLVAIGVYDTARTLRAQTWAAEIDPGNYRLQWQVGSAWIGRGQRDIGCPFALAAARRFPYTDAAVRLARKCVRR
jgi:O-antigen ligase